MDMPASNSTTGYDIVVTNWPTTGATGGYKCIACGSVGYWDAYWFAGLGRRSVCRRDIEYMTRDPMGRYYRWKILG